MRVEFQRFVNEGKGGETGADNNIVELAMSEDIGPSGLASK